MTPKGGKQVLHSEMANFQIRIFFKLLFWTYHLLAQADKILVLLFNI